MDRSHQHRTSVANRNGSPVATGTFLDPALAPVSAVWAVDLNGSSACDGYEPMFVVHNPNASNPIPLRLLPAEAEYVCTEEGGCLQLERFEPRDGGALLGADKQS